MGTDMNVVAKLRLGKTEIIWQVCLAPIIDDIVIGMDSMKDVDGITTARQGGLLMKDELIPGRYQKETDNQIPRVTVAMKTTLEPKSETDVIGMVDCPKEVLLDRQQLPNLALPFQEPTGPVQLILHIIPASNLGKTIETLTHCLVIQRQVMFMTATKQEWTRLHCHEMAANTAANCTRNGNI
ncbi:Hypothetical predicted protein [Mytilus galloprovincialis]|uniref:Peptidase A2 domain-containing protein n=1 Tax=Mytilus galloprovincialis TaxID=29158 RepID=A0A8B6EAF9_MYTGA|nr:Hypothetical predicted protein [Mytilus galloprovincialis]